MKTNIRKNDKNPAIEVFCSASNVKEKKSVGNFNIDKIYKV